MKQRDTIRSPPRRRHRCMAGVFSQCSAMGTTRVVVLAMRKAACSESLPLHSRLRHRRLCLVFPLHSRQRHRLSLQCHRSRHTTRCQFARRGTLAALTSHSLPTTLSNNPPPPPDRATSEHCSGHSGWHERGVQVGLPPETSVGHRSRTRFYREAQRTSQHCTTHAAPAPAARAAAAAAAIHSVSETRDGRRRETAGAAKQMERQQARCGVL